MSSEWSATTWGDLVTLEYGKAIRDYQTTTADYPVYGTNGPIGWYSVPLCAFPSVIIGRKGAYRGVHYSPVPFFVIDTAFYLKPKTVVDTKWAYYCLLTYDINGMDSGSAIPSTSRDEFYKLPVRVPPIEEQREIALFLSKFDDHITLLRETNATLEAIAQALFKSWFVDFDPVRAKQEGRAQEGMDEATAALFPDGFEESELGLVPMGWKLLPLSMAFDINPTRKLKKGKLAQYLDMASVGTKGHTVDLTLEREMGSGSKFCNGDTLLARITPCLENGKTAFVDFMPEDAIGWGSTEFVVLRPKPPLPEYFGYLLCRHKAFREHAIQSMSGTSGRQRIQNDVLGRYPVAIPTDDVAQAFGAVATALQKRIASNHATSLTLARLRDTLLPRLISGQLRLPEAEALAA